MNFAREKNKLNETYSIRQRRYGHSKRVKVG